MKNSTRLLLICIALCSVATAKTHKQNQNSQNNNPSARGANPGGNTSNAFTPFYSEDFASGLPSGWQRTDVAGNGINWKYTTTGANNGDSLNPANTSAANGYMIFDSDSAGNSVGGENADLRSAKINCSGHNSVHLNFNEYLIHYGESATVSVSNNGTTWTQVFDASAGLAQQAGTTNPLNVDVDLTAIAANQDTVYIKFNFTGDYDYYWMIDDVQLYELPSIDGSVSAVTAPVSSCTLLGATETVIVNVFNSGGDTIIGFDVTYVVDNGTPVTAHSTDTVVAGQNFAYSFATTADFSAAGAHTVTAYISVTGDTNATNDTVHASLFNGPHPVNTSSSYGTSFEPTDDLTGWETEDIDTNGSWTLSSLFPRTGAMCAEISGATANDWYYTTCIGLDDSIVYKLRYYYRTSSTATQALFDVWMGTDQVSASMTQELVPGFVVTNLAYLPASVTFTAPSPGYYFIGFHVTNTDSLVGFRLEDINISADSGVGITSIDKMPVSVYPNPSAGVIHINSNENSASGFTIEVMNTEGQLVRSDKTASLINYTLNLSSEPSGIYSIRIVSDSGVSARKISVSH